MRQNSYTIGCHCNADLRFLGHSVDHTFTHTALLEQNLLGIKDFHNCLFSFEIWLRVFIVTADVVDPGKLPI